MVLRQEIKVTVAGEDSYRVTWVGRNNVTHSRLFDSKDAADWFAQEKRDLMRAAQNVLKREAEGK